MEAKFKLAFVTVLAHCLVTWDQYAIPQFSSEKTDPQQLAVIPEEVNVHGNTTTIVVKCSYAQ